LPTLVREQWPACAFVPTYSGGSRAGFSPASLVSPFGDERQVAEVGGGSKDFERGISPGFGRIAQSPCKNFPPRPAHRHQPQSAKEIALAAGDLDASFHGIDSGEETPGGSDQTPDQDDVDRIGTALGVVEQDEKPLATTEKIEGRDRERWELDPASSEDYEE